MEDLGFEVWGLEVWRFGGLGFGVLGFRCLGVAREMVSVGFYRKYMSYGLRLGGTYRDHIGFFGGGGPVKGHITNLVQDSYVVAWPAEGFEVAGISH